MAFFHVPVDTGPRMRDWGQTKSLTTSSTCYDFPFNNFKDIIISALGSCNRAVFISLLENIYKILLNVLKLLGISDGLMSVQNHTYVMDLTNNLLLHDLP